MPTTLILNGLSAVEVRLMLPYKGVWTAEVDFDLELVPVIPTGPAVLVLGKQAPMVGFIDPDGSGKFGQKGRARVLGGFGGWHKKLPAWHFTSEVGVLSTEVLTVTAASVGEKVLQAVPEMLGKHYSRTDGAASRVLSGLDWYVDTLTGVTIVGPRLPIPVRPDTVEVLDWDPLEQRATIATDDVLHPGSLLLDTRFGTAQVRDVEQVFNASGGRATAHCRKESLDIADMIASAAREAIRPEYLSAHTYRVVIQSGDGRLALQNVKLLGSLPDMLPISLCFGVPGVDAKLAPLAEVLVEFADGDPAKPIVTKFVSGPPPLEVSIMALRIAMGLGTMPVVVGSPAFLQWVTSITAAVNTLAPGSAVLPVPAVSTNLFAD